MSLYKTTVINMTIEGIPATVWFDITVDADGVVPVRMYFLRGAMSDSAPDGCAEWFWKNYILKIEGMEETILYELVAEGQLERGVMEDYIQERIYERGKYDREHRNMGRTKKTSQIGSKDD